MKVLLTGEPRSGKTTLLEGFIELVPDKQGFITREVREDGERTGFELVSSLGQTATLATVESQSTTRVSRYGVDIKELNGFIEDLPTVQPGDLLYVDEIGQMQLFSEQFKTLISNYLNSSNPYVGTISSVYEDHFITEVLERKDIVLLRVDENNRQEIKDVLASLATNIDLFKELTPEIRASITEMARIYTQNQSYAQLKKLFKNAIQHVANNRVRQLNANEFRVQGNSDQRSVVKKNGNWICDCDLFNGKGDFEESPGECSHIQAVKLSAKILA